MSATIREMELDLAMSQLSRAQDFTERMGVIHPDLRDLTAQAVKAWRAVELERAARREVLRIIEVFGRKATAEDVIREIGR